MAVGKTFAEAKAELEAIRCKKCNGLGECDDADCNDIEFNRWKCTACGGTGIMAAKQELTTREQVRAFNNAFERPVHESWTDMSVTDRILVGKLLFEEVHEYITKGLGLDFVIDGRRFSEAHETMDLEHFEGRVVDPVEVVDGLADVNIVIHFNAHWHGFNLDRATTIVNDSNMSKLGQDGRPIINGVTDGYRADVLYAGRAEGDTEYRNEDGYDPAKPIGKILKGPNYWEPTSLLSALICEAGNNKP